MEKKSNSKIFPVGPDSSAACSAPSREISPLQKKNFWLKNGESNSEMQSKDEMSEMKIGSDSGKNFNPKNFETLQEFFWHRIGLKLF